MNLENYLNENYIFKYNEVLNRTFYRDLNQELKEGKSSEFKLLKSYKFNSIIRELKNKGIKVTQQDLNCLLGSDFVTRYDPFLDYFESLPKWDGETDYIGELAKTIITSNDELFYMALKKWLVAFVGCAIDEDITNHCVLIITGKQGAGKTTWLLNLVPETLKEYKFSGNIKPGNKDTTMLLSERILINMDELASYTKSQTEGFKELITKDVISERRAYGYFTENYIRRASFTGSCNHNDILMDVTGNRRFLVFEALDIDYKHDVNMDDVFSQAYALLKEGFKHYFDKEDIKLIESNNEQFKQTSIEEEYIDKYFEIPSENTQDEIVYYNASEVIDYIKIRCSTYVNINAISVGKLLKAKGFETKKISGINKYSLVRKG